MPKNEVQQLLGTAHLPGGPVCRRELPLYLLSSSLTHRRIHKNKDVEVFHSKWDAFSVRIFFEQGGDPNDHTLLMHLAASDGRLPVQTVYIAKGNITPPQPIGDSPILRAVFPPFERGVSFEEMTIMVSSIDTPIIGGPLVRTIIYLGAVHGDRARRPWRRSVAIWRRRTWTSSHWRCRLLFLTHHCRGLKMPEMGIMQCRNSLPSS